MPKMSKQDATNVPPLDDAPPGTPTPPPIPAPKYDMRAEVERQLNLALKDVLEGGSDYIARMSRTLSPALVEAILNGDTKIKDEFAHQIEGMAELARVRTMKMTYRAIRGVMNAVLLGAKAVGGVQL
jgi:hypothetical protein